MALVDATEQNFDELLQGPYVVVDFYGDHCGPCAYLAPFYREAANDMPLIRFVKINTTKYYSIAKQFDIKGVPTLKFFRNGEMVHSTTGGMNREKLNTHIAKMLYE